MEPITKQQKIALVIIGLVVLFIFYKKFYEPKVEQIQNLEAEISQKEAKLQRVKQRASRLEQLRLEFEALKGELAEAEQKLPRTKEISTLLRDITRTGQKYKIKFLSITPQQEIPQEYFIEIPIQMNIDSSYHSLGLFIAEIGQFERIINIYDLVMRRKDPTEEDPSDTNASFKLVTYVFKAG